MKEAVKELEESILKLVRRFNEYNEDMLYQGNITTEEVEFETCLGTREYADVKIESSLKIRS